MTKGTKGLPAVWRDALRDSDLGRAAKAVGFVLSTYLNAQGRAFPSLETLADGASVSRRTAWAAIARLEQDGFLSVTRSRGRTSHRYLATLPTVQPLPSYEKGNRAIDDSQPCNFPARNGATTANESASNALKQPPRRTAMKPPLRLTTETKAAMRICPHHSDSGYWPRLWDSRTGIS